MKSFFFSRIKAFRLSGSPCRALVSVDWTFIALWDWVVLSFSNRCWDLGCLSNSVVLFGRVHFVNIDCMGDLQAWSLEPNGALTDERQVPFPSPDPISLSIGDNCWRRAESIAAEIIGQVQPTVVSEQRRKAVIGCVQRLIRNCLGCEVILLPFRLSIWLHWYLLVQL